MLIRGCRLLLLCFLMLSCQPSKPVVRRPSYFSDLRYDKAAAKYKERMEKRYEARDNSYVLSVLDYAVVSLYDFDLENTKKAFTAAYKVDDGRILEAAKFYQWLQVDTRKVYKLTKREKELSHLYLGLAYLFDDNLEESLVEFKKLRQMDQEASSLPLVNFYMGLVYEKMGMYDDALIEYNRLKEMNSRLDAEALVSHIEELRTGTFQPDSGRIELIVQVDHQFASSTGRTVAIADDERIATLPSYVDKFEVKLTPAEAERKAAQDASAEAARYGTRCCGGLLGEYLWPGHGADMADFAGDVAFGQEDENKDVRFWGYAPVAVSVLRIQIPVTTREIRLVFYNRESGRIGSCRYPLSGSNARAYSARGTYFVIAGLAKEFYVY